MTVHDLPRQAFLRGAVAVLPLSLTVAPWGLLAGSMVIEASFTLAEGQGPSAIVFTGAVQLVTIGMLEDSAGFSSIIFTTLLLTSQHLLYGTSLRPVLSLLSGRWRIGLGFLLTDEFFVLASQHGRCNFNRWYALGVGLTLYIAWNLFTLIGILFGRSIPGLEHLGLDFSIVAILITLAAPLVRNVPTLVCVATLLFCLVLFSHRRRSSAPVLAGLAGTTVGSTCNKLYREVPWSGQ